MPFGVECEEISSTNVDFLELIISRTDTEIDYAPRVKVTNLFAPLLHSSSGHASSVHSSWPKAYERAGSVCRVAC